MNPAAPQQGTRRALRRWIPAGFLLILLGVLPAANLWLSSRHGRQWIAGKIQRRAGLDTRISGVSITPWNGVEIRGIELLQPIPLRSAVTEPLASADLIRLSPVWMSWLKGKPELHAIAFESPRMVIPIELLADLAASRQRRNPPAAAPPLSDPAVPGNPQPGPAAVAPPLPQQPGPAVPVGKRPPTGWLHLKNASLVLMSAASGRKWLELDGVSGSIPVAGGPAVSPLAVHAATASGNRILTEMTASLEWRPPLLTLTTPETPVHGIRTAVTAAVVLRSGLPLQIEVRIPEQDPGRIVLPGGGHATARTVSANARFRGILFAPPTWQGDFVAGVLSPSGTVAGRDVSFDRGNVVTVLRGGMLSCIDARLIGDELSLLGNATVLADGRLAGALRLVAPPDSATGIARHVFPGIPQPSLTPLSTPQRAAFDLEAFGNLRQILLRPGRDGPVLELKH